MTINELIRFIMVIISQRPVINYLSYNFIGDPTELTKKLDKNNFINDLYFEIPTIHCKDGFSFDISLNDDYRSENGHRKLGYFYEKVVVKNMSKEDRLILDNINKETNEISTIVLNASCFHHGGIDLSKTMSIDNLKSMYES